jgi:hypothetical protein
MYAPFSVYSRRAALKVGGWDRHARLGDRGVTDKVGVQPGEPGGFAIKFDDVGHEDFKENGDFARLIFSAFGTEAGKEQRKESEDACDLQFLLDILVLGSYLSERFGKLVWILRRKRTKPRRSFPSDGRWFRGIGLSGGGLWWCGGNRRKEDDTGVFGVPGGPKEVI